MTRLTPATGTPAWDTRAASGPTPAPGPPGRRQQAPAASPLVLIPLSAVWREGTQEHSGPGPTRSTTGCGGSSYPWPALLCLLASRSPSMIHCMIFRFFSASSEGPGISVLALFPDSAFLVFLLESVPAFPLQEQDLGVTRWLTRPTAGKRATWVAGLEGRPRRDSAPWT